MTRIIAGSAKGRPLKTPEGDGTRPTTDRVREALFSVLVSEFGSLAGLSFLDLFAGSGAVGLEALSRGADHAVLVERERKALIALRANVAALGLGGVVRPGTVSDFVSAATDQRFDVVYVDPPYAVKNAVIEELIERVGESLLAERGLIVIERSARDGVPQVPDRLNLVSEKNYGETKLIFLEHSSSLP